MPNDHTRDRIELQDVMLSYAAAVDERDRERYAACFTDDVEVVGFGAGTYHGREDWVAYVWDALEKYSATQHMLGPTFATLDGNMARTRTDVQAVHFLGEGETRFTLWAAYHSTLRREDGRWRICRHELRVTGTSSD